MKSEEYLKEIREADGLRRAVLRKIEITGRNAVFFLVTDVTYNSDDLAHAREVSARYVPEGFTAEVRVVKSVPDAEGIRRAVVEILGTRFPAIAAFVSPENVAVDVDAAGGRFVVEVEADGDSRDRLVPEGALDALTSEIQRRFCGAWLGEFRFGNASLGEIEREALPPAEKIPAPRAFPVCGYAAIDGAAPKSAVYLADLVKELQDVTVCGTINYIEERVTKSGKPFFTLTVSDGTGSLRCSYFTKKATLEKVRDLRRGDSVVLTGDNELYNGSLSFRAKTVDYGAPPEGFVPEARPSRPVPARYTAVFPTPVSDYVQSDLFGNDSGLPESFVREKFVVFDLETTGLNNNAASGGMDRIIEIGAVRIESGRIVEKFSSFVACPVRLSDEIVSLTGITDEMLVGAPDISDVIADFFRFTAGCVLVGHNVGFDFRFIRYYGEKEGYLFDQRQFDTVALSQEMLRLSNYKLNTVADYFGFAFHHHRAFDDAFVTAKIFIELIRLKNGLPR